jgi:hypothetical protein
LIGGFDSPLLSFLIWGVPYLGGAVILLIIGSIVVVYNLNECFKPWKHSVILFNNGFIYYYGALYQIRRYGSNWVQPISSVATENRIYGGYNLSILAMRSSKLAANVRVYVPESLRPTVQQWISAHPVQA